MENWKTSKGWHTISLGVPNYTKGKFLLFSKDKNKLFATASLLHRFRNSLKQTHTFFVFLTKLPKRLKELKVRYDDEYEDGELAFRGWKNSKGVSWQGCTVSREDRKHALAWRKKRLKSAGAIGRFSPEFSPAVDDTKGRYGDPELLDFDPFGDFDLADHFGTNRIF